MKHSEARRREREFSNKRETYRRNGVYKKLGNKSPKKGESVRGKPGHLKAMEHQRQIDDRSAGAREEIQEYERLN